MTLLRSISLVVIFAAAVAFFTKGFQLFGSENSDASVSSEQNAAKTGSILTPDAIKSHLENKLEGIEVTGVAVSPMDGFYQVFYGGQVLYVSFDGKFIMSGNLLGLSAAQPVNLTEIAVAEKAAERSPQRAASIAAITEDDMVVFKAPNEEFEITVFTDVDCAYCRKLHKEVPQLNELGVTVRYLAFPRAGLGSSAHKKLESVWCSEDKLAAMNLAKLERKFSSNSCESPIPSQYKLTRELRLSGTPAVILPDGELISGYMPYNDLHQYLKDKSSRANNAGR